MLFSLAVVPHLTSVAQHSTGIWPASAKATRGVAEETLGGLHENRALPPLGAKRDGQPQSAPELRNLTAIGLDL